MKRSQKYGVLRWKDVSIHEETESIVAKAAAGQACVIAVGPLVLFATGSRDAWMLDPKSGTALQLARDGEALVVNITETDRRFSVEWTSRFRIEGPQFIVTEVSGRSMIINGYPTAEIFRTSSARPLPQTSETWLAEILHALEDARSTKPFALATGTVLTETQLFHLAPHVALKFRGLDPSERERTRIVETALANYVVHSDPNDARYVPALDRKPGLAFALCYVAAHYAIDVLKDDEVATILSYCESNLDADRP